MCKVCTVVKRSRARAWLPIAVCNCRRSRNSQARHYTPELREQQCWFPVPCSLLRAIFQVPAAVVSLADAEELNCALHVGGFPDSIPRRGGMCDAVFLSPSPQVLACLRTWKSAEVGQS